MGRSSYFLLSPKALLGKSDTLICNREQKSVLTLSKIVSRPNLNLHDEASREHSHCCISHLSDYVNQTVFPPHPALWLCIISRPVTVASSGPTASDQTAEEPVMCWHGRYDDCTEMLFSAPLWFL